MQLLDNTYFLNKSVYIPQAVAQPSIGGNTPDGIDDINQCISEREWEFLVMFLGYAQATALYAELEQVSPATIWTVKPSAAQKWKDLVNGAVLSDGKKKWNGLRYEIGTKKVSIIAYYVYFYYLREDFSTYTTTGVQVPEAENSTRQTPNAEQTRVWNKFVDMYGLFNNRFLNYSFFSNWNGMGMTWLGNFQNNEATLYEFMQDRSAVFDLSFFSTANSGVVNSMGL